MPKSPPSPKSARKARRKSPRLTQKPKPRKPKPPNDTEVEAHTHNANNTNDVVMIPTENDIEAPQSTAAEEDESADVENPETQNDDSENEDHHDETAEESSVEAEFEDNPKEDSYDIATDKEADNAANMGQVRFAEGTYKDAVTSNDNPVTEIEYKQRRMAVMVTIPEVDNNIDRLRHLVEQVNEFLKFARKRNTRFRLRKFDDISKPGQNDKSKWRTRMIENSSSDFKEYIQGYYPFTAPRGGTYRLRINAVFDASVIMHDFIQNVTHDWGQRDSRSLTDIKAQRIWDPVKIGYMMRATKYITHSYELVEALEAQASKNGYKDLYFGISWGTIPSPVGGYDKDTAVQAVIIETNKVSANEAIKLMQKWYPLNPKKAANPPYPGNFRFVINRDNQSVKGNPIAIANLSVLMERQGIFNQDTKGEQTHCIKSLKHKITDTLTFRDRLLAIESKTSGDEFKKTKLFMSVSKAVNNRSGESSTWFTFHNKVADEATSVVKNLPAFIKKEWVTDPERFCFAQFLNDSDTWDKDNRVANNADTDEIALAATEYTLDLQRDTEQTISKDKEKDDQSMTSKAMREMRRMMGNDSETVASISKERPPPKPRHDKSPVIIEIDASKSVGAISGVSATSSKTEIVRAKLQQEFDAKFKAQQDKMETLAADKLEQESKAQAMQNQLEQMTEMMKILQEGMANATRAPIAPHTPPSRQIAQAIPESLNKEDEGTNEGMQLSLSLEVQESTSDIDFGQDPTDEDYAIWLQQQEYKKKMCMAQGIAYVPEPYDVDMTYIPELPLSPENGLFDTDDDELPAKSRHHKRLVQTQSDEQAELFDNVFETNRSNRAKKRTNATGGEEPAFDV